MRRPAGNELVRDRREQPKGPVTVIRPVGAWQLPDFRELWAFRDLLLTFAIRDIKIRYKQTVVGIAWAVLQPVTTMIVFSLLFGRLAGMPSDGLPYPLFTFAALVPWQLFHRALTQGSNSLVTFNSMMSKVYFPRLYAPLASILSSIVDFTIALAILLVLMVWYGMVPGPRAILLPLFVLLAVLTALAVSLWLSALNVSYRDVEHALPFLAQIWMFVTPVVYPMSQVPEQWRWLLALNPMAGVIEGFRWCLLNRTMPPDLTLTAISSAMMAVLLVGGLYYFNRVQLTYADRV